jgi:hypothetical protein
VARRPSAAKLAQAYRDLWNSELGHLVLSDLLVRSGALLPARDAEGKDLIEPIGIAIHEGQRRIGLHIMDQLTTKPSDFVETSRQAFDAVEHYWKEQMH